MEQDTARKVCQLIAGIVIADDDLDPAEDAFIDRMLSRFGLTEADRDALFPIADANDAREAMKALDESLREETLQLLIEAASADGQVVDEEREYLNAVAEAMDAAPTDLDARIAKQLAASKA